MAEEKSHVVFLIEDDKNHAEQVSRSFGNSRNVIELVIADSVSSAIAFLEKASPSVILCDYLLPDGTGLDILHHYIEGNRLAPPFILLTSQGDEKIAVQAIKAGAIDYIVKTETSLLSLPEICRAVIREHELRREKTKAMVELSEKQKLNETLLYALPYPALLIRGGDRVIVAANKIALQNGAKIGDYCWSTFGKSMFNTALSADSASINAAQISTGCELRCSICRGDQCLFEEPNQNIPEVIISGTVWDTHWIKVSDSIYLHYAIDVTGNHKMQNDLQNLIREQNTVLNTSIVGITKVFNRIMVWVNRAMCDIFGYTLAEMENAETRILYASEDDYQQFGAKAYSQIAEGMSFSSEIQMKRKDGSLMWLLLHGNAIIPSHPEEGSVWIFEDITERKHIEEITLEREEKYRRLVDNSPDIVYVYSTQSGGIYYSPRVETVLGYSPEYLYEHPMLWTESIHPDDQGTVANAIHRSTDGTSFGVEYRVRDANGNWRWLYDRSIERHTENGETLIEGLATDITERRHLEAQLRESQKMESIGQLAGGIAHDFNNILTVIMGYCNLLGMNSGLEGFQKEAVGHILSSSEKAAQLTNGLLAFSRKQTLVAKQTNLNDIVQNVQMFLFRIIGEDIQFKLIINEVNLPVKVDIGQIEQVLINLSTNARDAMQKGGLLSIETGLHVIDDTYKNIYGFGDSGRYAFISVSDTGSGMDEETRSRIFEPFFTTKEVGKGTGLGMAIVHGVIKQHNGFINVYSELGVGTTFRVYIPIVEADKIPLDEIIVQAAPRGGTETILLAEDDVSVRELVTTVLSKFGYNVIEAEDGQDAIDKFIANKDAIQLILMDVIMPRKNGQEANDEIRQLRPGMKVLYTSGYTADFIKNRGVSDEEIEIIIKPVHPLDLVRKVRALLETQ